MLVQGTIHRLIGERRWVAYEFFHEFAPCIPIVLMVFVQNYGCRLLVHRLIVQGLVGIAKTYWVSWWLGVRGGPISKRGIEGPHCIGQQKSVSWKFSQPFIQHFSNAFAVAPVGAVYLDLLNVSWGPLTLHYSWCGVLMLIPAFLTCYEFSLYHLRFRALFCSWVVWWEYCLRNIGRPPRYSYYLCLIVTEIVQLGQNKHFQLDQIAEGVLHLYSPLTWWIKVLHLTLLLPLVDVSAGPGALLVWYLILGDTSKLSSLWVLAMLRKIHN